MTSYFQDNYSGVVLKFETDYDKKEMLRNPEYKEVDEKAFKAYRLKRDGIEKEAALQE